MSILFQSVKVIDSQSKYNNKIVDVLVNKGVIESIDKNIEPPKDVKSYTVRDCIYRPV